jgi:hypothetical protein
VGAERRQSPHWLVHRVDSAGLLRTGVSFASTSLTPPEPKRPAWLSSSAGARAFLSSCERAGGRGFVSRRPCVTSAGAAGVDSRLGSLWPVWSSGVAGRSEVFGAASGIVSKRMVDFSSRNGSLCLLRGRASGDQRDGVSAHNASEVCAHACQR